MSTDNKVETLFLRRVPIKLKNEFKAVCAKEDISMQDKINELMETYVRDANRHSKPA